MVLCGTVDALGWGVSSEPAVSNDAPEAGVPAAATTEDGTGAAKTETDSVEAKQEKEDTQPAESPPEADSAIVSPETATSTSATAAAAEAEAEAEATQRTDEPRGEKPDPKRDLVAFQKLLFLLAERMGLSAYMASTLLYTMVAIYLFSYVNGTAAAMWWRLGLWGEGLLHMAFSTDARFNPKKQPDPQQVLKAMSNDLSERLPTRRIIFIRCMPLSPPCKTETKLN